VHDNALNRTCQQRSLLPLSHTQADSGTGNTGCQHDRVGLYWTAPPPSANGPPATDTRNGGESITAMTLARFPNINADGTWNYR
jgi:hypothetical protein